MHFDFLELNYLYLYQQLNYSIIELIESMTPSMIFSLQWSYFRVKGKVSNYQSVLKSVPSNIFQLSFWTQVMMLCRIEGYDIPESAVFYLSDQSYLDLLSKASQKDRINCNFKLKIAAYIFKIDPNQSLLRNISQAITAACAMTSPHNPQINNIKINAIVKYLQSECDFLHASTLKKIAHHLSSLSLVNKQIKQVSDNIIGPFTVHQTANNFQNISNLIQYLIKQKKVNVFYSLRDYFIKSRNPYIAEVIIEMSQKLGLTNQLLISFQANSVLFYELYQRITSNKGELQFINFSNFMIKYSCIQSIVLHRTIFPYDNTVNLKLIRDLLAKKNYAIFKKISMKPTSTCLTCIKYYLSQSKFKVPTRTTKITKSSKEDMSLYDPLCTIAIVKKFWDNSYHNEVISYCLWIMLSNWILKAQTFKPEQEQLFNYHKNIFLILVQLAISYKANNFVNYYPIQNNLVFDMLSIESLPTLLVSNEQFLNYLWIPYIGIKELNNLIKFQKGYDLFWIILNARNPADINGSEILGWIQYDFVIQKNSKFWQQNLQAIHKILNYFSGVKNLTQQTESLKKAIQKQQNWFKSTIH